MKFKIDLKKRTHDTKMLNFFEKIFVFKNLYRQGWIKYWKVQEDKCESVADHSYSMSLLAYIFAKENRQDLNADKVLRIALFHDLPEIVTGDIPVSDNFPAEEKAKLEKNAISNLFVGLRHEDEFKSLCVEYMEDGSEEAKFVRQIDRLDFVMQGYFYENHGVGEMDFERFATYAKKWVKDAELLEVLEEILQKTLK